MGNVKLGRFAIQISPYFLGPDGDLVKNFSISATAPDLRAGAAGGCARPRGPPGGHRERHARHAVTNVWPKREGGVRGPGLARFCGHLLPGAQAPAPPAWGTPQPKGPPAASVAFQQVSRGWTGPQGVVPWAEMASIGLKMGFNMFKSLHPDDALQLVLGFNMS